MWYYKIDSAFDGDEDCMPITMNTIKRGDSVRPKGCRLVGKVIQVTDGYACVDFVDREVEGQILTGVYPVEDLEIRPEEELSAKEWDRVNG